MTKLLIQSYVWHDDKSYFVSTISIRENHTETVVWEWLSGEYVCGEELMRVETQSGIDKHIEICLDIYQHGIM